MNSETAASTAGDGVDAPLPQTAMELVHHFRQAATEARARGQLDLAGHLEGRAKILEDGTFQNFLDYEREVQASRLRDWEGQQSHYRSWQLDNQRNVIGLSQAALRGMLLINAGAVVSLLAFLGNVWAKGVILEPFLNAMWFFAAGVVLAVLATALSYLTQLSYGSEKEPVRERIAVGLHVVTILISLSSLGAFCMGSYRSLDAFRQQQDLVYCQVAPRTVEGTERDLERRNYPPPKKPPAEPPRPVMPVVPSKPAKPAGEPRP